jgi:hypothetical protein
VTLPSHSFAIFTEPSDLLASDTAHEDQAGGLDELDVESTTLGNGCGGFSRAMSRSRSIVIAR